MTSKTLRILATVLALPALCLGPLCPLASQLDHARLQGISVGGTAPSLGMPLLLALYSIGLAILYLGSLHRPSRQAMGWGIAAGGYAATAVLLMTWVGYKTHAGFSSLGAGMDSLVPWVFGPSVATYGIPAAVAVLAAALSSRHRGVITASALGLLLVAAGGLGATSMLTKLTWGVWFAGSARETAVLAYAGAIPELALGALLLTWLHPSWQEAAEPE